MKSDKKKKKSFKQNPAEKGIDKCDTLNDLNLISFKLGLAHLNSFYFLEKSAGKK